MKLLHLLFFLIIIIQTKAQVYISEKSSGHKITFLIINEDCVIIERYSLQLKSLAPMSFKTKDYQILNNTASTIKTNEFEIVKKTEDTLCLENINYLSHYKSDKCGDFTKLDSLFCNLNNAEKLNVCRNCYFLLHPPKTIKMKLKEYPKQGLEIIKDVDCKQDHSAFLKDLSKISNNDEQNSE